MGACSCYGKESFSMHETDQFRARACLESYRARAAGRLVLFLSSIRGNTQHHGYSVKHFVDMFLRSLPAVLLLMLLVLPLPAADLSPEDVLTGLRGFYRATARPDGSFQPGVDASYGGMSDSAHSDLAPVAYA